MQTITYPAVDGYELLEPIRDGQVTFRARRVGGGPSDDNEFAVKILPPGQGYFLPSPYSRLHTTVENLIEADVSIVPLLETTKTHDGQVAIVTPYYPDGNLTEKIVSGGMSPDHAIDIIGPVTEIVAKAHRSGLVLANLNPDIIVYEQQVPAIALYGSRSLRGETGASYRSPETGRTPLDTLTPTADVYSLAAMLGALIAGYPKGNRTVGEFADELQTLGCPPGILEVIKKAMSHTITSRYRNATDFLTAVVQHRSPKAPAVTAQPPTPNPGVYAGDRQLKPLIMDNRRQAMTDRGQMPNPQSLAGQLPPLDVTNSTGLLPPLNLNEVENRSANQLPPLDSDEVKNQPSNQGPSFDLNGHNRHKSPSQTPVSAGLDSLSHPWLSQTQPPSPDSEPPTNGLWGQAPAFDYSTTSDPGQGPTVIDGGVFGPVTIDVGADEGQTPQPTLSAQDLATQTIRITSPMPPSPGSGMALSPQGLTSRPGALDGPLGDLELLVDGADNQTTPAAEEKPSKVSRLAQFRTPENRRRALEDQSMAFQPKKVADKNMFDRPRSLETRVRHDLPEEAGGIGNLDTVWYNHRRNLIPAAAALILVGVLGYSILNANREPEATTPAGQNSATTVEVEGQGVIIGGEVDTTGSAASTEAPNGSDV